MRRTLLYVVLSVATPVMIGSTTDSRGVPDFGTGSSEYDSSLGTPSRAPSSMAPDVSQLAGRHGRAPPQVPSTFNPGNVTDWMPCAPNSAPPGGCDAFIAAHVSSRHSMLFGPLPHLYAGSPGAHDDSAQGRLPAVPPSLPGLQGCAASDCLTVAYAGVGSQHSSAGPAPDFGFSYRSSPDSGRQDSGEGGSDRSGTHSGDGNPDLNASPGEEHDRGGGSRGGSWPPYPTPPPHWPPRWECDAHGCLPGDLPPPDQVRSVPEPDVSALLASGLILAGFAMRLSKRRRRARPAGLAPP